MTCRAFVMAKYSTAQDDFHFTLWPWISHKSYDVNHSSVSDRTVTNPVYVIRNLP
jgi:hypothetical protein